MKIILRRTLADAVRSCLSLTVREDAVPTFSRTAAERLAAIELLTQADAVAALQRYSEFNRTLACRALGVPSQVLRDPTPLHGEGG